MGPVQAVTVGPDGVDTATMPPEHAPINSQACSAVPSRKLAVQRAEARQGLLHAAKLTAANGFLTPLVDYPGSPEPVEIELVQAHDPEWLAAHLAGIAQEDNQAKKKGFYVDVEVDGSFTVPHEIDRPDLRPQIWWTADMIRWFLVEDALRFSFGGGPFLPAQEVGTRLAAILERGPDG